jgi:aryl-alcohol dehydrogenase-like predicted oxidoreductase
VGARRDAAGGWLPAATPAELREGVEDNLRTLRTDRIDLVNLRRHHAAPDVPLADQLGTLQELRQEGKLDMIGISNVPREVAEQALTQIDDLSQVQNAYSILDRRQEPVLDFCRERDIAFVPFFPLGSAFGGGPRALARDPAVARVAADWDATPAQIALAWLLARYDRMLPIPGTSSVAHLEENLAAAAIRLDDADLAALDGVGQVGDPTT